MTSDVKLIGKDLGKGMRAEVGDRGCNGWIGSPTQWIELEQTQIVEDRNPGVLRSMGLQRRSDTTWKLSNRENYTEPHRVDTCSSLE